MQYNKGGIWLYANAAAHNNPKYTANVIKNYVQHREEQRVLEVMF